eukprot:982392-Rhodomonas_salina.1
MVHASPSLPSHSPSRMVVSSYSLRSSVALPGNQSSTKVTQRPDVTVSYWREQANSSRTNGQCVKCAGTYVFRHRTRQSACTRTH